MTSEEIMKLVLTALISSSIFAGILSFVLLRRTEKIKEEIKLEFAKLASVASSQRAWKERSISELLGPINMQFERTVRAFMRWNEQNLYVEAKVIKEGNETIRNLLLEKGHLIPQDLLDDAGMLIEHYDRWLEEFEKLRGGKQINLDEQFVFVGVGEAAIPFPTRSSEKFQARFREMWQELYGSDV